MNVFVKLLDVFVSHARSHTDFRREKRKHLFSKTVFNVRRHVEHLCYKAELNGKKTRISNPTKK